MIEPSPIPPIPPPLAAFPEGLPRSITVARLGASFRFMHQFKHDFFAATGLYQADAGTRQVVLKIQRRRPLLGLPLGWLGAWLTRHEATIYQELAGVPGVPSFVDFLGPTGFIHAFVPGRPLDRPRDGAPIPDKFFDELADLLAAVHARGLAYVDLNKRQNVLVGEDGHPWLIDFQISFRLPANRRGAAAGELPRAVLAMLQRQDWYHFHKHKRRCRPDLMTASEIEESYRPDGWINIHRRLSRPYFLVRRRLLDAWRLPHGDAGEG